VCPAETKGVGGFGVGPDTEKDVPPRVGTRPEIAWIFGIAPSEAVRRGP
jgi:hypothetical protein